MAGLATAAGTSLDGDFRGIVELSERSVRVCMGVRASEY